MSAVLLRLFLFLLPILIFLLWLWIAKGTRFGRETLTPQTERRVTRAGLALIAASLAGFVVFAIASSREEPRKDYVPPRMIDGEIAPGAFKDRQEGGEESGEEDG